MENHGPYDSHRNHGADIGEKKHGSEQTRPLDSHIQRHREKQGDQYSTRYRNTGIYQVIDKGNLEVFILKHLYVVAQSHEIKGFEPVIIGKGYDKPHNNRDTHKNQETHKIGQDEKITLQPFFLKFSFRHSRIFCHILILS